MADSTSFVVRPATPADLDGIYDLMEIVAAERRWIGTEPPVEREQRRVQAEEVIADEAKGTFLVAEADGIIASLGLFLQPYGVADLGMMVAEEWRGRGVGSALMEAAVAWARASSAHKISLQHWPHNEAAHALYRKFGFVEEGVLRRHYRRQSGEVWDAVVMGLLLDE
jgi:ribosomal-protein-alanine N-acetyltransferase